VDTPEQVDGEETRHSQVQALNAAVPDPPDTTVIRHGWCGRIITADEIGACSNLK